MFLRDIDHLEVFTTGASSHNPFSGMDLGFCTQFKENEVPNLNKFTYDKLSGRIVKEQVNKVSVTRGNPILVLTQLPIIRNVNEYPIFIASTGATFMNFMEDNIWNLCQKYMEEERIKELEEQLQQVKIDKGILQSFKARAEKVITKLKEEIINMFTHLHLLQQTTATIIDQHGRVQAKNMHFYTI
jgi:hypothetical protein